MPRRAGDYRSQLRGLAASSAAPYGYTLTLWTSGAVTIGAEGLLSELDALLLLAGALLGFGTVGAGAFEGLDVGLDPGPRDEVRLWGALHLPSVGLTLLAVSSITGQVHGPAVWALVGFVATSSYLLLTGAQFWFASRRSR